MEKAIVETYPVDIDPAQVVRWLKRESKISPPSFRIAARRTQEVRELPPAKEAHLGDEEREDLSRDPARSARLWRRTRAP